MEYNNAGERQVLVDDIESGGNGFPGDINSGPIAGNKQGKRLLNKLASGVLKYNILASDGSFSDLDGNLGKASLDSLDNLKLLIDKNPGRQREERVPLLEKEHAKEKPQSTNSKKAFKPPRPPKGPSLDTSDLKLVEEISELVMKKRARMERIKALKRARATKLSSSPSSSTSTTLCGMAVTIVFFLIIIFQGLSWRNSSTLILQGSPEPATGTNSLISVQVFNNLLPSYGSAPSSEASHSVEQLFGSGFTSPG